MRKKAGTGAEEAPVTEEQAAAGAPRKKPAAPRRRRQATPAPEEVTAVGDGRGGRMPQAATTTRTGKKAPTKKPTVPEIAKAGGARSTETAKPEASTASARATGAPQRRQTSPAPAEAASKPVETIKVCQGGVGAEEGEWPKLDRPLRRSIPTRPGFGVELLRYLNRRLPRRLPSPEDVSDEKREGLRLVLAISAMQRIAEVIEVTTHCRRGRWEGEVKDRCLSLRCRDGDTILLEIEGQVGGGVERCHFPAVPAAEAQAAQEVYHKWLARFDQEASVSGEPGGLVIEMGHPRAAGEDLLLRQVGQAWQDLVTIAEADVAGIMLPSLGRCPAPGTRGQAKCGRWFIDQAQGNTREYCSPTCQRRAKRREQEIATATARADAQKARERKLKGLA